jgi:pantoate--beta-alanine ligase
MRLVHTRAEVREWSREQRGAGRPIGLVPTMGSLHVGHTSLVEIARRSAEAVVLSIFVNPLQFAPTEDFDRYPRDLEADLEKAAAAGVDLVFAPSVDEMYPQGRPWVVIVPEQGADVLCGRTRPGHFTGVLTVVSKLFSITTPDLAVFGLKDFQQLTLIRRMTSDLDHPVEIVPAPIVREADGLALSSRNRYLSQTERESALRLSASLRKCEELFESGERRAAVFRETMTEVGGGGVSLEYAEVVHPETLEHVDVVDHGTVCAVAARVGSTRLIDNHALGIGFN